jgi:hypothetical protein
MNSEKTKAERLAELRDQTALIEQAMREVHREVRITHKRAGAPLVVWEDGQIVWIPADQIVIDEPPMSP